MLANWARAPEAIPSTAPQAINVTTLAFAIPQQERVLIPPKRMAHRAMTTTPAQVAIAAAVAYAAVLQYHATTVTVAPMTVVIRQSAVQTPTTVRPATIKYFAMVPIFAAADRVTRMPAIHVLAGQNAAAFATKSKTIATALLPHPAAVTVMCAPMTTAMVTARVHIRPMLRVAMITMSAPPLMFAAAERVSEARRLTAMITILVLLIPAIASADACMPPPPTVLLVTTAYIAMA
jgi:hypothetical protein